jgi:hypothetical protein
MSSNVGVQRLPKAVRCNDGLGRSGLEAITPIGLSNDLNSVVSSDGCR